MSEVLSKKMDRFVNVVLKRSSDSQLMTFLLGSRGKERKAVLAEIARRGSRMEESGQKVSNPKPRSRKFTAREIEKKVREFRVYLESVNAPRSEIDSSLRSYRLDMQTGATRKYSNPTRNHAPGADEPVAYELASYLYSVDRGGGPLASHLRMTAKKPGFDRERYGEFLAKTHMGRVAEGYYGSKVEAKRFATLATKRVAGEIFVDHILSGEWE